MLQSIDANEAARVLRRQGNSLLQNNQPAAALDCFERALQLSPGDALILNDRGNALQDLQRLDEALSSYDRALSIQPEFAAALTNRSNVFRAMRRLDEALRDLDAALRVRPAFPEALNNRGNVLRDMRRLREALASFDAALALKPELIVARCNRGNTLLDLGLYAQSLACFDDVLAIVPQEGEALFGRGIALLNLRQQPAEAVDCFDRAAACGLDRVESLVGKSAALAQLKRHGEAAACLAQVVALAPERDYVFGSLLYSRLQAVDWSGYFELVDLLADGLRAGRKVTYPLSALPVMDSPELNLQSARIHVEHQCAAVEPLAPARASMFPARERLRIAYLSGDFRDHPVSHLLVGVLEHHDRQRFEVLGVALRAGDGSDIERRIGAAFDRLIDVGTRNDREVAELLRELEVDVAVDLMGSTEGCRPGIFAHRAAPVQVSYLGYPGTSGAPYMDYLLADGVVIPPEAERWYTEKVIRLPGCVLPNDDRRAIAEAPSRSAAGLPEQGLVFCAFTNAYKINPPVFDVWMRLLRELPDSVLWLRAMSPDAKGNLSREAASRGVDAQRLVFAPHVTSMAEHLGRHQLADLYLDTLPYNAHSTACDALWAGVPVLTCTGRTFAARVATSVLTAAGLPELITKDLQEYASRALELARDPDRLQSLRRRLTHRSALFDTRTYCQHLENAYHGMLHENRRLDCLVS